jgi:hypothetical protein
MDGWMGGIGGFFFVFFLLFLLRFSVSSCCGRRMGQIELGRRGAEGWEGTMHADPACLFVARRGEGSVIRCGMVCVRD